MTRPVSITALGTTLAFDRESEGAEWYAGRLPSGCSVHVRLSPEGGPKAVWLCVYADSLDGHAYAGVHGATLPEAEAAIPGAVMHAMREARRLSSLLDTIPAPEVDHAAE